MAGGVILIADAGDFLSVFAIFGANDRCGTMGCGTPSFGEKTHEHESEA